MKSNIYYVGSIKFRFLISVFKSKLQDLLYVYTYHFNFNSPFRNLRIYQFRKISEKPAYYYFPINTKLTTLITSSYNKRCDISKAFDSVVLLTTFNNAEDIFIVTGRE